MQQDRRKALFTLTAAAGCTLLPNPASSLEIATMPTETNPTPRATVTGIGGFFFRAKDPKALAQWYLDHLGIALVPSKKGDQPWHQQAGTTAFSPFPEDTGYFGADPSRQWMLNFRTDNIERLTAQLTAAGIPVKLDAESSPYGRFAHLHDPEGNPLELWQPA